MWSNLSDNLWLLFIAWCATRAVVIAVGLTLAPNFVFDELQIYESWGQAFVQGSGVSGDSWQYPPMIAPLLAVAQSVGPMTVSFVGLALLADLGILIALTIAARSGASWYGPWFWVLAGIFIGPAIFSKLDIFPALMAVCALLLAARPKLSGAFAALGALLKLWPAFMLLAVPRRRAAPAAVAFAVTVVAVAILISLRWPSVSSAVANQGGRGLEAQSAWALPFLWAKAFGVDVPIEFGSGAFEIGLTSASALASLLTVGTVGATLVLIWAWLTGRFDFSAGSWAALFGVLMSLVLSRVLSPQFNVWTMALCAVVVAQTAMAARTVVVLLVASSLATQATYAFGYASLKAAEWPALLLHSARVGLLVAATIVLGVRLHQAWSRRPRPT